MSALVNHIRAINAKTQKWLDENPGSWAGMIVEDPEHWAGYGIYTPAQYDRYMLEAMLWEVYKEVNGCRPRGMDIKAMSDAELQAFIDRLCENF